MVKLTSSFFLTGAVCVCLGTLPVSAAAEITLLAEWLANGAPILTTLSAEGSGSVTLEDIKTVVGRVADLCSGILVGTIGPDGKGEITEELNLSREKISELGGLALLCTSVAGCAEATEASPIEDWPGKLPWPTLLYLKENGEFAVTIFSGETEVLCLVLGVNSEDRCTAATVTFKLENSPETGDATLPRNESGVPAEDCSLGGPESGIITTDESSPILLSGGGLLTMSSE